MGMIVSGLSGIPGRWAQGAEWSAEPSLAVRGEYNSNLLLTSDPHSDVWGIWVSPGVKFAGSTERLEVTGKVAADFVQYFGDPDRGLTNLYFPLTMRYKTERDTLGFDGGFTRDNTLMGELRQTGVVLSFTQRNLWNLSPSWTHEVTDRLSIQAGYQYVDAAYENGLPLGLVNYTTQGGSAGLLYHLTEKDDVQVTGIYTNFHAPQAGDLRSDIYGGQLGFTHFFTESLTVNVAGGPRWVDSAQNQTGPRVQDQQLVGVFNATLRQKWEDSFMQIDVGRDIYPSGFGLLLQTDRAAITYSRDMTERLTLSVNAAVLLASSVSSIASTAAFPENRYVNVTPRVTWKISDWWAVDANYTYAQRDVDSFNVHAFSHAASVMLTYYPPKFSVGR